MKQRPDSMGFFWHDEPPEPKVKKEKVKVTPPEPVWLDDNYLPNLEIAKSCAFNLFTDRELLDAQIKGETLIFDVETYSNYLLIAFQSLESGKQILFEMSEDGFMMVEQEKLKWVMSNFKLVGFNSKDYDIPIIMMAIAGRSNLEIKGASDEIVKGEMRGYQMLRKWRLKDLTTDHIDIIEVAPLRASLKLYTGRVHCRTMQDLPFDPNKELSDEQLTILRWYCMNDLVNTQLLYEELLPEIELRVELGKLYNLDIRSKSDAQIAEAVFAAEVMRTTGFRAQRPQIAPGIAYKYQLPRFISFASESLQYVAKQVADCRFVVSEHGGIIQPEELKKLKFDIAGTTYQMGIGGLHSCEKKQTVRATDSTYLVERDVASYYPAIILILGLYPEHLGRNFLSIYKQIVDKRLAAKHSGDELTSATLKIVINGSFGKLGSKWSILYSPNLLIQVTLTGQLSLLYLIEKLELAGVPVVSANTDGIVIHNSKDKRRLADSVIAEWESETQFVTEETEYSMLCSRDVNNYIAITKGGGSKVKGIFAKAKLQKNPTSEVCTLAVEKFLTDGTPMDVTIKGCADFTKFLTVRTVKGGAVKNGEFLGKAIRWYYGKDEEGVIVYAKTGNKVPKSEGAVPCMELPTSFPVDVSYEWYFNEAEKMLESVGFYE